MFHVEPNPPYTLLASTKDFLVSGESFEVRLDQESQVAYTHPKPSETQLPRYYASEDYISHGNQKASFIDKVYAVVQKRMLHQKQQWLQKFAQKDQTYLDFGCGTGNLVAYLNNNGWKAFGVEPSEKARLFSEAPNEVFPDLKQVPKKNFEIIALWHVLEHLPNPAASLDALKDHLAKDGFLFLALPNYNSFDAKHYQDDWAAYDVPRHLWHFSEKGIVGLCKQHGFEMVESKGLFFDAFYVSYLSEKHKNSKAAFIRGMAIGLWSNMLAFFTQAYSSKVYVFRKSS